MRGKMFRMETAKFSNNRQEDEANEKNGSEIKKNTPKNFKWKQKESERKNAANRKTELKKMK